MKNSVGSSVIRSVSCALFACCSIDRRSSVSFRIAILACLPLLAFAGAASAAGNELEKLFARHPDKPASNICMLRHYDEAHLAAHPNQNVTDMLVYIGKREGEDDGYIRYSVNAQVKFRDSKKKWSFAGDCGREAGKATSIGCGIDCEGGGYDVSLRGDKSVELTITSSVRLNGDDSEEKIPTAGFKSDDKTFLLQQTALKDCLPLIYDDDLKAKISKGLVTR
jgi:hypothetical protein